MTFAVGLRTTFTDFYVTLITNAGCEEVNEKYNEKL